MYSSTTLERIGALYDAERIALNHDPLDWRAAMEVRAIVQDIREELSKLWPKRRAEETFTRCGPPRFLGGGTEHDQQRTRQIAHGIAPLPSGGD